MAKSIRSLGRQVGKAESTVRKWIAREDWPFALGPPWEVRKVRAWAEIQLKPDPAAAYRAKVQAAQEGRGEFAGMGPVGKAKLQYIIERALAVRQRRLTDAGKLHDVEDCDRRRRRQIHEVKSALLALGRSIANSLVGQDRETIERLVDSRCAQICEEFSRG
ncbi:MAG TPA: hypothetical protein VNA25_25485 [Phycisphaerae bacterium]|nr:hypothetical protein [Phycisphaerae bacterium]